MTKLMAKASIVLFALFGFIGVAQAQSSCPYIATGAVLTAGQWNTCFSNKQDALGFSPLNAAGGVMTGPLITAAPISSASGFNLPPGTAPSSPNNGDMWTTSAGLFAQINGTTIEVAGASSCTGAGAFQVGTGSGVQCSTAAGSVATLTGGPLTVNPTALSTNQGIVVTQSSPASGTPTGPFAYNQITVTNDIGPTTGGATNGLLNASARGFQLSLSDGSATGTNIIGALFQILNNQTSTNGDRLALVANAFSNQSQGGFLEGADIIAQLASGATQGTLAPLNVEAGIASGATATQRYGVEITNLGTGQASGLDAAIVIDGIPGSTGGAFKKGLLLGSAISTVPPLDTGGDVIANNFAMTVANFANLPNVTVTGNILSFPFASLTGNGQLNLGSVGVHGGIVDLAGATQGTLKIQVAANVNANSTITLPNGTTDFSATGGTSQVVKQTSAGAAFTVGQLAASDLSNGTTGSGSVVLSTTPTFITNITAPLVIGGTAAGSSLILESTSGTGTTDFIAFQTGTQSERMRILDSGCVAIGTAADCGAGALAVGGLGNATGAINLQGAATAAGSFIEIKGNTNPATGASGVEVVNSTIAVDLLFQANSAGRTTVHFGQTIGNWAELIDVGTNGLIVGEINNAPLLLGTNNTGRLIINANGSACLGCLTSNSVGDFQINGQYFEPNITTSSAATTGTVCWTTGTGKFTADTTVGCLASLEEAKNIIAPLRPADALDMVSKLKPFAFRYRQGWGDSGQYEQFGLGAHQVASVDERMVGRDPEGALQGVRYQELTAVLAAAIKELKADNDNLREDLRRMRRASP
jgi:hypothetical protein